MFLIASSLSLRCCDFQHTALYTIQSHLYKWYDRGQASTKHTNSYAKTIKNATDFKVIIVIHFFCWLSNETKGKKEINYHWAFSYVQFYSPWPCFEQFHHNLHACHQFKLTSYYFIWVFFEISLETTYNVLNLIVIKFLFFSILFLPDGALVFESVSDAFYFDRWTHTHKRDYHVVRFVEQQFT